MIKQKGLNAAALGEVARVIEAKETPALAEFLQLGSSMSQTIEVFFQRLEESVNAEFRSIGSYIEAMKCDIANLQANDLKQRHLPTAGRELDAVVSATEEATNTIMEAAEAIMAADPGDPAAYKDLVDQEVMKIFEACSFQDITGQRISKVVETLQLIDTRVSRFAKRFKVADNEGALTEEEAAREERKRELLLDGPSDAAAGAIAQDEIDRLLDKAS